MSILICDDNEDLREILSVILKDKYHVITAKDGLEGISKFMQHRPKVVLMDLKMPGMSGIEATKKITEIEPDTCVIGFTAYATTKAQEFLNAGVKAIIEKPIKMSKLIEQINLICQMQNINNH
ncbi:MAG: response regulator [Candidatus Heimdallarchaeaceae archaeon]